MKAILVVDIPDDYGDVYDNKAIVTLRNGKLGTSLGIYNVPLKPMPKRMKNMFDAMDDNNPLKELQELYCAGYNKCLEEVEK